MNISLTLYIPTYRRLPQLACLIDILDRELNILTDSDLTCLRDSIEILISSNEPAETACIKELIQNSSNNSFFRLIGPVKTINANDNIIAGSSTALHEYVWIFCDDDIPAQGSLLAVFRILASYHPSLLYLKPNILLLTEPNGYIDENKGIEKRFKESVYKSISLICENKPTPTLIDSTWLQSNAIDLLRASSLVYSRLTTHHFWQTSRYSQGTNVKSLALALDSIEGGSALRLETTLYTYIDYYKNKISWANEWPLIKYLQAYPLIKAFLKEHHIQVHPIYDILSLRDVIRLWRLGLTYKNYLSSEISRSALIKYSLRCIRRKRVHPPTPS